MNAVASAVACPPAASKKIRRKSDNKVRLRFHFFLKILKLFNPLPFLLFSQQPQSQINKCNNEKRRREQENEFIEQLGEFLQINKRDMNATKPDKAAILNEVVKTVNKSNYV